MMQVSKKIPFDDPQVLMYVRILYIATNIIIAGIYLYLQQQINKKKGEELEVFNPNDGVLTPDRYDNSQIR